MVCSCLPMNLVPVVCVCVCVCARFPLTQSIGLAVLEHMG